MPPKFEARAFLEANFHDAAGVVAYLRGKGVDAPPTEEAVKKWLQRNSLPGEWLAVLVGFLEGDKDGAGQIAKYTTGD